MYTFDGQDRVRTYLRLRPTLQLSLDLPRKQRLPVLLQNCVRDHRIPVFRVEEESVHVKQTCADRREAFIAWGLVSLSYLVLFMV